MWKRIKFYSVSAIILALGGACLYLYYFGGRQTVIRRVVDAPAVVREIQELSELVTVRYSIQKVVGLEEDKVPFGSERILLMVQGDVLGGVDLSLLSTNDVQVAADGVVTARLRNRRSCMCMWTKNRPGCGTAPKHGGRRGSPTIPNWSKRPGSAALEAIQAAAVQMGILSNAQDNAENTVRKLLCTAACSRCGS